MARKSKKQIRKLHDKKCFFCPTDSYELLDGHRIFESKDGGTYNWHNILTCCSLCHRKIHSGMIKIFGQHPTSSGRWIVHYEDENGEEKWVHH